MFSKKYQRKRKKKNTSKKKHQTEPGEKQQQNHKSNRRKINNEAVSIILFSSVASTINPNPTLSSFLSVFLFSFSNSVALGAINAPLYILSFVGTAPLYQVQIQILLQNVII